MKKTTALKLSAALAACLLATPAMAAYNLQITEIWPGNGVGANLTEDWFEITNYGDTAWTELTDGSLWFQDDRAQASPLNYAGIAEMGLVDSILPGESVIYVNGGTAGRTGWLTLWGAQAPAPAKVGAYAGRGLGQGGDFVNIFVSPTFVAPASPQLPVDSATYPNGDGSLGGSWDVGLAAFSVVGNAAGAVATSVNDMGEPAIGSPGRVAVPEPATGALAAIALLTGVALRRRIS
jgi:hypothetical protein